MTPPATPEQEDERTFLEKMEKLQAGYIGLATQDGGTLNSYDFGRLRDALVQDQAYRDRIPDIVRRYREGSQFWQFIKNKFPSYHERRQYIWAQFKPLLDYLEFQEKTPGVVPISATLETFDPDNVHAAWQKALDRRASDPEGAITAARTLLETVCKHILDEAGAAYADEADLPKLWGAAAVQLNLAPHQHQEPVFKAILGNCQSIVSYLGSIRNKIGDAHGQGRKPVKPKPRHAELVVNLAGAMAAFLVATAKEQA